jgi:hypothetical protein
MEIDYAAGIGRTGMAWLSVLYSLMARSLVENKEL